MTDPTMGEEGQDAGGEVTARIATQGAGAQVAEQMLQALNQSQADMKRAMDHIVSSIAENMTRVSSLSEDISKLQDIKSEESMSAAKSIEVNDQVALARLVNNRSLYHLDTASSRAQTAHDNMQAILQLGFLGSQFAQNAMQNLMVADTHQQCAKNWSSRCEASGDEAAK